MAQVKKKMQIKEVSNYLTDFSNKRSRKFWSKIRRQPQYISSKLESLEGPYPKPRAVQRFQHLPWQDLWQLAGKDSRAKKALDYLDLTKDEKRQIALGEDFEKVMDFLYTYVAEYGDVDRQYIIDSEDVGWKLSLFINSYNETSHADEDENRQQLEKLYGELLKYKKFYVGNQKRKVSIITPVPWKEKNKESELVGELDAYCLSDDRRRIDEFKCITSPSSSGVMKGYCQLNLYMLAIKDEKPTNKEDLRFESVREKRGLISNLIILNILTKKLHRVMIPFDRDVYYLLKEELVYFARKR